MNSTASAANARASIRYINPDGTPAEPPDHAAEWEELSDLWTNITSKTSRPWSEFFVAIGTYVTKRQLDLLYDFFQTCLDSGHMPLPSCDTCMKAVQNIMKLY